MGVQSGESGPTRWVGPALKVLKALVELIDHLLQR
ncbi:hypothetical protein SAMN04489730_0149 [Amycolatopsis australiensis]|uniref:Uncharacterized protein n=1 Tax=Amycolatopsis australiensis TaxID=546364 RepID=A0A1K1LQR7_9PSEU|nr:hypothetical protein SAMN04489730_0149 [Amycolatopsis australiensis]